MGERHTPGPLKERVCAICGKGGSTTPVTMALAVLGIAGSYAHPKCLRKARRAALAKARGDV